MTSTNCLVNSKLVREIVKNYNVLDYTHNLKGLLSTVYPETELDNFCRRDLHEKINALIVNAYDGEQVLKYRLFKAFCNADLIAAYEIRVKNSRVDFMTIDDHTTSYEIKSSLDNLYKLAKQSSDYLSAFEFNNIVVHERHLNKCIGIVPDNFGLIMVDRHIHTIIRKPVLNKSVNSEAQVSLLTKKELLKFFGINEIWSIIERIDPQTINKLFKEALKARYHQRWNFIVEHSDDIFPIDLQFFFNKNIKPICIYG